MIFSLLFLLTSKVLAQTSIKAEVDKISLTTDETLTYKLTVTSSEKKIPSPDLPKFEGFIVVSKAQSSKVSFVKGNIKTVLIYTYILAPIDIGRFKIEPSSIKIKDKTYSTEVFKIQVIQGKAKPKVSPEEKPSEQPQITL